MAHYNDCSATYSTTMSMDLAYYVQEQQPQTRGHACRNHCHQVQSQIQGKQDHDSGEKVQPLAKNLLRVKFSVSRCSFCEKLIKWYHCNFHTSLCSISTKLHYKENTYAVTMTFFSSRTSYIVCCWTGI